jgi:hypothetical protein
MLLAPFEQNQVVVAASPRELTSGKKLLLKMYQQEKVLLVVCRAEADRFL